MVKETTLLVNMTMDAYVIVYPIIHTVGTQDK